MATTTFLSVAQWARDLGIPQRTLAHRLEAVPPDRTTRRARLYSFATILPAVIPDLLQRHAAGAAGEEMSLSEATRRQRQASALLAEYDLAEKQGTMVRADDIVAELDRRILPARAKLLGLPARLAPVLNPEQPEAARRILEQAIHETLEELAGGADDDDPGDDAA